MVLSGLFKKALDSFLLTYVEGEFSVDFHIFGPHSVELHNLQLKCDVISKEFLGPSFPFKLESVTIGSVYLDIPLALGSRPVAASIENVAIVLSCIDEEHWSEDDLGREWFEFINNEGEKVWEAQLAESKVKDKGALSFRAQEDNIYHNRSRFYTRLISKILDNTKIELRNVAVQLHCPAGFITFSLGSLDFHTTDKNWEPHFDSDCDNIVHKLLDMKDAQLCFSQNTPSAAKAGPESKTCDNVESTSDPEYSDKRWAKMKEIVDQSEDGLLSVNLVFKAVLNTSYIHGPGDPHRLSGSLEVSDLELRIHPSSVALLRSLLGYYSARSMWLEQSYKRLKWRSLQSCRNAALVSLKGDGYLSDGYTTAASTGAPVADLSDDDTDHADREASVADLSDDDFYQAVVSLLQTLCKERVASPKLFGIEEKSKLLFGELVWLVGERTDSFPETAAGIVREAILAAQSRIPSPPSTPPRGQKDRATVTSAGTSWFQDVELALEASTVRCNGKDVKLFPAHGIGESEIEVKFIVSGPLGITLRANGFWSNGPPTVQTCVKGSQAAQVGVIEQGMRISALNGYSVDGLPAEDLESLLNKDMGRPLTVRLQGTSEATKVASKYLHGASVNVLDLTLSFDSVSVQLTTGSAGSCAGFTLEKVALDLNLASPASLVTIAERISDPSSVRLGVRVQSASLTSSVLAERGEERSPRCAELLTAGPPEEPEGEEGEGELLTTSLSLSVAYRVTSVPLQKVQDRANDGRSTAVQEHRSVDVHLAVGKVALLADMLEFGGMLDWVSRMFFATSTQWFRHENLVRELIHQDGENALDLDTQRESATTDAQGTTSTTGKLLVNSVVVMLPGRSNGRYDEKFASIECYLKNIVLDFGMDQEGMNSAVTVDAALGIRKEQNFVNWFMKPTPFFFRYAQSEEDTVIALLLDEYVVVEVDTPIVQAVTRNVSKLLCELEQLTWAIENLSLCVSELDVIGVAKNPGTSQLQPYQRLEQEFDILAQENQWTNVFVSNKNVSSGGIADRYGMVRQKIIKTIGKDDFEQSNFTIDSLNKASWSHRQLAKDICEYAYSLENQERNAKTSEFEFLAIEKFFSTSRDPVPDGHMSVELNINGLHVSWAEAFGIALGETHMHYITDTASEQAISDIRLQVNQFEVFRLYSQEQGHLIQQVPITEKVDQRPFLDLHISSVNRDCDLVKWARRLRSHCDACSMKEELEGPLMPSAGFPVQAQVFHHVNGGDGSSIAKANGYLNSSLDNTISQTAIHSPSRLKPPHQLPSGLDFESEETSRMRQTAFPPVFHISMTLARPKLDVLDTDFQVLIGATSAQEAVWQPARRVVDPPERASNPEPPPVDSATYSEAALSVNVIGAQLTFKAVAPLLPANGHELSVVVETGANLESCFVVRQHIECGEIEVSEVFLSLGTDIRKAGALDTWPDSHHIVEPCKANLSLVGADQEKWENKSYPCSSFVASLDVHPTGLSLWTNDAVVLMAHSGALMDHLWEVFGMDANQPVDGPQNTPQEITASETQLDLPFGLWSIFYSSSVLVADTSQPSPGFEFGWRLFSRHQYALALPLVPKVKAPVWMNQKPGMHSLGMGRQVTVVQAEVREIRIQVLQNVMRSLSIKVDAFLPVLELVASDLVVECKSASLFSDEYFVNVFGTLSAMFYNMRLALWEPLVEPWERVQLQVIDAPNSSETMTKLIAMNRLNLNISEDSIKTVTRLYQSLFPEEPVSFSNIKLSSALVSSKAGDRHAEYVVVNETGIPFSVEERYQIGANSPGTLHVNVLEGWSYPGRMSWGRILAVELVPLPGHSAKAVYISPSVDVEQANQMDAAWGSLLPQSHNPDIQLTRDLDAITVRLRGCSNSSIPKLSVRVFAHLFVGSKQAVEMRCTINLIPYVLGGYTMEAKEWFPLHQVNAKKKVGELFLGLRYEQQEAAVPGGRRQPVDATTVRTKQSLEPKGVCAVSFKDVGASHWFSDLQHNRSQVFQIMNTTQRSVFRRLGLRASFRDTEWRVPMDEPGKFILSAATSAHKLEAPGSSLVLNDGAHVSVTVVMRGGAKRLIRLRSPMVVKNTLPVPVEVLVCRSDDLEERREYHGVGKLERVRFSEGCRIASSGNFLEDANCGITRALDGNPDTKWVDGGHQVHERSDLLSPQPLGRSWIHVQLNPTKPVQLCAYAVIPSIENCSGPITWSKGMVKQEMSESSSLDVYPGTDPFSWVIRGRTQQEGAWKVLHRVADHKFNSNREPAEFKLPADVSSMKYYEVRIDFKLRPVPFKVARALSDSHKYPRSRVLGPKGGSALSLGGFELFQAASHESDALLDYVCDLCNEVSRVEEHQTAGTCWLCGSKLTRGTEEKVRPRSSGEERKQRNRLQPVKVVVQPGSNFPVPIHFLVPQKESRNEDDILAHVWSLYVRPVGFAGEYKKNWSQVFHDLALKSTTATSGVHANAECVNEQALQDESNRYFSMHTRVRCKRVQLVRSTDDLLVAGGKGQVATRTKVYLAPFMRVRNALPYSLKVTFLADGKELGDICPQVIRPGMNFPICAANRFMDVRFHLLGLNLARSLPVPIVRSRLDELLGGRVSDPVLDDTRHKDEEIPLYHISNKERNDETKAACFLRLKRLQDSNGTFVLTLYAETWWYNLSDVDLLIHPAKVSVRSPAGIDVYLPSSFNLVEKPMFNESPNLEQKKNVTLPALVRSPTNQMKIAGVLWRSGGADMVSSSNPPQVVTELSDDVRTDGVDDEPSHSRLESTVPAGDPMWLDDNSVKWTRQSWSRNWLNFPRVTSGMKQGKFYLSGWSSGFDISTTSLVTEQFKFTHRFGSVIARKEVGIEVSRPSQYPFSLTTQVVVRSRFVVLKQSSMNLGFELRTLPPALALNGKLNTCCSAGSSKPSKQQEFNDPQVDDQDDDGSFREVPIREEPGTQEELQSETVVLPHHDASSVRPLHFQTARTGFWVRAISENGAKSFWSGQLSPLEESEEVFRLRAESSASDAPDLYIRLTVRTAGSCTVMQLCEVDLETANSSPTGNQQSYIPHQVRNETPFCLELWQSNTNVHPRLVLRPYSKAPIAWEEPTMEKRLRVRVWEKKAFQRSRSFIQLPIQSSKSAALLDGASPRWKVSHFERRLALANGQGQDATDADLWEKASGTKSYSLSEVRELAPLAIKRGKGRTEEPDGLCPLLRVDCDMDGATRVLTVSAVREAAGGGSLGDGLKVNNKTYRVRVALRCVDWELVDADDCVLVRCGSSLPKLVHLRPNRQSELDEPLQETKARKQHLRDLSKGIHAPFGLLEGSPSSQLRLGPGESRTLEFSSNLPFYQLRLGMRPQAVRRPWNPFGWTSHGGENAGQDLSKVQWVSVPLSARLWNADVGELQVNSAEWNESTRLDSEGVLSRHAGQGDLNPGTVLLPGTGGLVPWSVGVQCSVSQSRRQRATVSERSHVSVHVSSVGLSLLHASMRRELAYLCVQRVGLRATLSNEALRFAVTVGNFQLDDMNPVGRFPVVIAPVSYPVEPFAPAGSAREKSFEFKNATPLLRFGLTAFQSDPRILHIGSLELEMSRLCVSIDESFLVRVMLLNQDGDLDRLVSNLSGDTVEGNSMTDNIVLHPSSVAEERLPSTGSDNAPDSLLYIEMCALSALHVHVRAELEGGKHEAAQESDIGSDAAVLGLLPVLNISDLSLRFNSWGARNKVVSSSKLTHMLMRHYILQGIKNIHKVLATSSGYGNPLSAGYRVLQGSVALVKEPVEGLRQSSLTETVQGLQVGTSTLVVSMVNGATEMLNGVSGVLVDIVGSATDAIGYDPITWPVALTLQGIHSLSGAIARGTNKLRRDLMESIFTNQRLRMPRHFGTDGQVVTYGPGSLPMSEQMAMELVAARRLQQWYRNNRTKFNRSLHTLLQRQQVQFDSMLDLDDAVSQFSQMDTPEGNGKSEKPWTKAFRPLKNIGKLTVKMVSYVVGEEEDVNSV